jgi:hypothetical protein
MYLLAFWRKYLLRWSLLFGEKAGFVHQRATGIFTNLIPKVLEQHRRYFNFFSTRIKIV